MVDVEGDDGIYVYTSTLTSENDEKLKSLKLD